MGGGNNTAHEAAWSSSDSATFRSAAGVSYGAARQMPCSFLLLPALLSSTAPAPEDMSRLQPGTASEERAVPLPV
ncbi:hypothetical protein CesoFtcFv8_010624 [Champsocephalus esox]|uniref:Uncharacterized protein n=2 Tax=Champsocephalus TaxID=52236 RepID=A0AAN8DUD0_CHAGU|nr:hypothetical protein CesoFtcFv8_010624 [Champsocephalus esox]KAK5925620.1 hypothetical protein CgunFtcFv8_018130 [Champsocephalus gunnari]